MEEIKFEDAIKKLEDIAKELDGLPKQKMQN